MIAPLEPKHGEGGRRSTDGESMTTKRTTKLIAAGAAAITGVILGIGPQAQGQAQAQTPEQFYKGKTIDVVIGYPPAGSNDVYARLLTRHIGKHIPGNPTVVPQNKPGAGSFLALGHVYNVAPKDGTVIGIGAPTAPLDEKLGNPGVRFKSSELNWIGRIDSLINIVFLWHTSPVKNVADAQKIESKLSGTGVGSTVSIYPTVMNNVLGTKFKLIMGYKGSSEAQLAVERGGRCADPDDGAVLGRDVGDMAECQERAGARLVLRHHGGIARNVLTNVAREQPRIDVVGAGRRVADHQLDVLALVELLRRLCGGREARARKRCRGHGKQACAADDGHGSLACRCHSADHGKARRPSSCGKPSRRARQCRRPRGAGGGIAGRLC